MGGTFSTPEAVDVTPAEKKRLKGLLGHYRPIEHTFRVVGVKRASATMVAAVTCRWCDDDSSARCL